MGGLTGVARGISGGQGGSGAPIDIPPSIIDDTGESDSSSSGTVKTHFYGTTSLDPVKAKMDFATIMDEVVQQFTAQLGIEVTITVEIEAKKKDGFDESLQRTIKENCNVLKFNNAEFEEE